MPGKIKKQQLWQNLNYTHLKQRLSIAYCNEYSEQGTRIIYSPKKYYAMKTKVLQITLMAILFIVTTEVMAQQEKQENKADKLVIVWTSDDPYVAERVALMYTHAAKTAGWFSEVTLIIWGPSAKLTAENLKIQEKLKSMQNDGVEIKACIVCADAYGVTEELRNLDFEVKGMGKPLTEYLKSDANVLTF